MDTDFNDAMKHLINEMNREIDLDSGEVFYTDEAGTDHKLSRAEYAGGYNVACYVSSQEVPVGYVNLIEQVMEMEPDL
jgi:hypothetical protein